MIKSFFKIGVVVFHWFLLHTTQAQTTSKEHHIETMSLGKAFNVFTTAQNTDLRLTLTHSGIFDQSTQPLETEIAVFVNPEKSFQKFLGIGGAITDASAEVFSKLSKVL